MMHAFDNEAGQRNLRRAEQANAVACGKPGEQLGVQCLLVALDRGNVESSQIVQRGAEADDAGDRRRAGLEAQGRGMELGVLIIGDAHHLAAELPVTQLQQRFAAAVQYADAIRPVELMAGEHVEIATQRGHVVTAVHHALRTVDDGQRTLGLGQVQ